MCASLKLALFYILAKKACPEQICSQLARNTNLRKLKFSLLSLHSKLAISFAKS